MTTNQTPPDPDALLCLVERVKENYREPPPPPPPKRGQKREFSALSFLLLAAVAVTLRTFGNTELRKFNERGCEQAQYEPLPITVNGGFDEKKCDLAPNWGGVGASFPRPSARITNLSGEHPMSF